jgi:hypothetical protein
MIEIEADTFRNTCPHDAAIFNKSLKTLANYLQLNHGKDVSEAVCNMMPANIILPDIPQPKPDPNKPALVLWELFLLFTMQC